MSLVGPRPERPEFIEQLSYEIPNYLERLGLRPGLTGLAQVINSYDTSLASTHRKVASDLLYLQNCCFRNDTKVLFRTISVILTGKRALQLLWKNGTYCCGGSAGFRRRGAGR